MYLPEWWKRLKRFLLDQAGATLFAGIIAFVVGFAGLIVVVALDFRQEKSSDADRQILEEQAQAQDQARFTTLISGLADVRIRMAQLTLQYQDRAPTLNVDLGQPLIEEAVALLNDKRVSANAYQKAVLAQSLIETNQPYRAEPIAAEAESEATNILEKVVATQVLAVAYFNQGKADEDGRQAYIRALNHAGSKDVMVYEPIRQQYRIEILQSWISSELRIKDCTGAKELIPGLDSSIKGLPETSSNLRTNARRLRDYVVEICP